MGHAWGKRNAYLYRILVGKPERKRPLWKPRHRWEDNEIDLTEMRWGGMEWIYLVQDKDQCRALANMVTNICVA
jgi:hypothetical protein